MDECLCIMLDENENCVACGKHGDIPSAASSNSGDIGGICLLLDTTAKAYAQCVEGNIDPKNPKLTRLRLVGSQLIRVPHKVIFKEILQPSFKSAKALGYRGTYEHWSEMVFEVTPPPTTQLSH